MSTESERLVSFGPGSSTLAASERFGNKAACLARMASMGLPVPPGFALSIDVCRDYFASGRVVPAVPSPTTCARGSPISKPRPVSSSGTLDGRSWSRCGPFSGLDAGHDDHRAQRRDHPGDLALASSCAGATRALLGIRTAGFSRTSERFWASTPVPWTKRSGPR